MNKYWFYLETTVIITCTHKQSIEFVEKLLTCANGVWCLQSICAWYNVLLALVIH